MMDGRVLSDKAKDVALRSGADLAGVVAAVDLPEHNDAIQKILPRARSVIVVAARHSLAALKSGVNETAQFDTIHTYDQSARAAHAAVRWLEERGFPSVAVPAFIPLDMGAPGKGMRGEICWRRAGVRAGLGSYGENGLLITKEFGAAIRLSGLCTTAELVADGPVAEDRCDHCLRCVEACPVGALSGEGKIDKKLCGDHIFQYGFRYFQKLIRGLAEAPDEETKALIEGRGLRELWQTFMTGNYYYCFECQSQCPATKLPTEVL